MEDKVREQLEEYRRQYEQAQQRVLALSGAIQALERLLEEQREDQPD